MNYKLVEKDKYKYIEYASAEMTLNSEGDALDIIAACFESNTNLVLLHSEILSENFFNLRTGLAGMVLQKFINYQVKVAVIIKNEENFNDRFREMVLEANKGNNFRFFKTIIEAEPWLLNAK